MAKINIFSGFLGAGKTTLIKKLISEGYKGEKIVLIENEFGEIGVDGGFLEDAGIEITEMNSGCICCSLVGDFGEALNRVIDEINPDRILIEPSGVGKLSDVIKAVKGVSQKAELDTFVTVADAARCKMYMKNFGEFYNDQIENAGAIILSHTDNMDEKKLDTCISLIREKNSDAVIVTTPWDMLSGKDIIDAMEHKNTLADELAHMEHHHHHDEECDCGCHEHHHHHHDEECDCGCNEHHHHHADEECDCGCHEHHHHHPHDGECDCGCNEHHHHHHHDGECDCGCHEHHHHHHHADEVFTSWGKETAKKYSQEDISNILAELEDSGKYGTILRAKGIVAGENEWIHFDYIPGSPDVRLGSAGVTGRICVIGSGICEEKIAELFGL